MVAVAVTVTVAVAVAVATSRCAAQPRRRPRARAVHPLEWSRASPPWPTVSTRRSACHCQWGLAAVADAAAAAVTVGS